VKILRVVVYGALVVSVVTCSGAPDPPVQGKNETSTQPKMIRLRTARAVLNNLPLESKTEDGHK